MLITSNGIGNDDKSAINLGRLGGDLDSCLEREFNIRGCSQAIKVFLVGGVCL